jgi:hypothetical protein
MEIYSDLLLGSIGQEADVKVFDDAAGAPGTMLFKLNEVIDAIDSQGTAGWAYAITRKHVSFASPLVLPAGTYWFGMSGTTADIGQSGVYDVQNDGMWLLNGDTPQISLVYTGDMAFGLEGLVASVPEPISIALFGTGLLGIGLLCRRRTT